MSTPAEHGAPGAGLHDLTAAYAVDAVSDAERRQVEAHLAACAACREELAALREALSGLADDLAVAPPPALRARVLAALDDEPQLAALDDGPQLAAPGAPAPRAAHRALPGADGPADELAARRARRRRAVQALAAAAAAVVVAGAALLGWTALQLRADRDAAQQAAVALAEVASAPDAVTVPATAQRPGWQTSRVVVSRSRGEAVLIPAGAAAPPPGRTWQLWYLDGDSARSAGTFDDTDDGPEVLRGEVGAATAVAVSLEPDGGSERPTTTPVAVYTVPA